MRAVFVAFDQHHVDSPQLREQLIERRLGFTFQFTYLRPAPVRNHNDFGGAGAPMLMAVLSRLVDIKIVMRMLNRGHTQFARLKLANQINNQRGLADIFKAGYAENLQDGLATQEMHHPFAATDLPGNN